MYGKIFKICVADYCVGKIIKWQNYDIKRHRPWYSIQLFHGCLVNSQNYATRCRGQLNALLPEAARPRPIVH